MTLEELLQKLKGLKRPSDVFGRTEYFPVISNEYFKDVELLIRQYALDNHDAEMGELKAKVYAYEQIIANSNFAPMLVKPKEKVVDIGRLAEQVVGYGESEDKE
ncbi:MAG: hypothetical protein K6F00_05110 [Lachnospiraceae bacterium]|nr:hypothetical protein [Lachnospiraceae bacterium]